MKKEVRVTNSLSELNRIRDVLDHNQIKYFIRTVASDAGESSFFASFFFSNRRSRGSFGENPKLSKMYYVYVGKSDYEKAKALI